MGALKPRKEKSGDLKDAATLERDEKAFQQAYREVINFKIEKEQ